MKNVVQNYFKKFYSVTIFILRVLETLVNKKIFVSKGVQNIIFFINLKYFLYRVLRFYIVFVTIYMVT